MIDGSEENSLLISVKPEQLRGFRCYDPAFEQEGRPVHLGLKTLAMGDSMAVELAQTAHLGVLVQLELVDESTLLSMDLPAPRGDFFAGVVIDDLILFEVVARSAVDVKPGPGSSKLSEAWNRYKELGLMPHEGKTFHDNVEAEFWGAHVEGQRWSKVICSRLFKGDFLPPPIFSGCFLLLVLAGKTGG